MKPSPEQRDTERRNAERRAMAPLILARLVASKAASDEIRMRVRAKFSDAQLEKDPELKWPRVIARAAIEYADALITELDAREKRT